ncbi:MAG: SsrA-binding protein SmpB [Gemmatimonadetes bacterium]|nr:SsrA-binding protein SmpB [Gemmatimonadota bacterium]
MASARQPQGTARTLGAERPLRIIARNPRARHDYQILERWEAGLVLAGTEVKALRAGRASLAGAFARVRRGEVWLEALHIPAYVSGNRFNHDPLRSRKLLLHRREIRRLIGAVEQKGLALVPLELYFRGPHAKVVVALGRGKKAHDRREDLKRRDAEREMARAVRRR